ncbi:MAG: hypothetical protein H7Z74_01710 [Anaerolineae bacterium]|nr:hypothetical protein [Gemmatimonadaceae bacterium]
MSDKAVLFVVSLFVIVLASALVAVWRLRKHAAQKVDAERRMGAALEELNKLTARLRAEQIKRDAGLDPGSIKAGDAAASDAGNSVNWKENK